MNEDFDTATTRTEANRRIQIKDKIKDKMVRRLLYDWQPYRASARPLKILFKEIKKTTTEPIVQKKPEPCNVQWGIKISSN